MTVRRWVGWRTTTHTFGTKHFCLVGVGATSSSHHVFRASPAPVPLPGVLTVSPSLSLPPIHFRAALCRTLFPAGGCMMLRPRSFSRSLVLSFSPPPAISISSPSPPFSAPTRRVPHEESLTRSTPNSHSGSPSSFPPLKTRTAARGGRRWRTGWPAGGSRGG